MAFKLYLKILAEGAETTEAGSLFQCFTTLTENADPFLQQWLAPWSTFGLVEREEGKKCSDQCLKGP